MMRRLDSQQTIVTRNKTKMRLMLKRLRLFKFNENTGVIIATSQVISFIHLMCGYLLYLVDIEYLMNKITMQFSMNFHHVRFDVGCVLDGCI